MCIRSLLAAAVMGGALVAAGPGVARADDVSGSSCTRPDQKRPNCWRCIYGPIEVPGGGSSLVTDRFSSPDRPGFIRWARASLVKRNLKPVDRHVVHLHHAMWTNPTKQDLTWPGLAFGDRWFASGKERTKLTLPPRYGYHWSNEPSASFPQFGKIFGFNAHLDGMHKGHDATVYVQLELGLLPDTDPRAAEMIDVRMAWLDVVNGRTDPVYTVPKKPGAKAKDRRVWNFRMPVGGRFMVLGGHLHDGGIKLILKNTSKQRNVFTSRAIYPRTGSWDLRKMTSYSGTKGKRFAAGDNLRLISVYDARRRWKNVMGIMVGAFVPDRP